MWDRLRQRAYWPEVGLRFDAEFDSDDQRDDDQAFLSGDTRRLFDHRRDEGRSYQATIELDWDLGGVVYPLESVDLSRELRQVVSLRDDVADEINQLYFERQSIREKLSEQALAGGSVEAGEVARLHWRAQELDAGLDAWTGGWISRWRALQSDSADLAFHPDQIKINNE
jgi:predicted transcriptional regulator